MKTVKLSGGKEVMIKELTVRMMKEAAKRKGEMEQSICIVSQATGLSEEELDDMSLTDFMPLQKAIEDFLSKSGISVPQAK